MAIQVSGTTVIGNSRSLENIASVDATTVSTLTTALTGKQTADAELTAISGLATNGLITKTGAGTAATRTVTGTANQITVTNGDGVAGDPTIAAVVATQAEAEAGTDNTTLMTPLRVEQHMTANALGWGQTWQSVSRTAGTNYQNTTGRPIMIAISGTGWYTRLSVGETTASLVQIAYNSASGTGPYEQYHISAIIPNGHYYQVNGNFSSFAELR